MTQENKELLLGDLASRLPYGVKVQTYSYEGDIENIETLREIDSDGYMSTLECDTLRQITKPYLFPLSSMTEEQFNELKSYADLKYEHNTLELVEWDNNYKTLEFWLEEIPSYQVIKVFNWLYKNHFDVSGLIPLGLAKDATGLGIYGK